MASTPIEFDAPSGLTLTVELYLLSNDTLQTTVSATEGSPGTYHATVTDAVVGYVRAAIKEGSNLIAKRYSLTPMADNTTTVRFGEDSDIIGLDSVETDTAALETDWTDGGRLDAILDAIKAKTDLLGISTPEGGVSVTVPGGTTLSVDYSSLHIEVGYHLGFGRDPARWASDQYSIINSVVSSGLRQFYNPPALSEQAPPHVWSFLRITTTLTMADGDYDYDLPSDCGGVVLDMSYAAGDGTDQMPIVTPEVVVQLRASQNERGRPKYAAIRPKASDGTAGQLWECIFYPEPDDAYVVTYRYSVLPQALTSAAPHPLGGGQHAETIFASCLAAVESYLDDKPGVYTAKWLERLAASVAYDELASKALSVTYSNAQVAYGTYEYLSQEVAKALNLSPNKNNWNHNDRQLVDSTIQRGLNQFYLPPSIGGRTHRWSFLRPTTQLLTTAPYETGTIAVSSGVATITQGSWPLWAKSGMLVVDGMYYDIASRTSNSRIALVDTSLSVSAGSSFSLQRSRYTLPSDFAGLDGEFTYPHGASSYYEPVRVVSESVIRNRQELETISDRPLLAAVRPLSQDNTVGTQWEVAFWPTPDAQYILTYRYRSQPGTLGPGEYPTGGVELFEPILASCIDVAREGKAGAHQKFLELLQSAILTDQGDESPESLGFNSDRTEQWSEKHILFNDGDYVSFSGTVYN